MSQCIERLLSVVLGAATGMKSEKMFFITTDGRRFHIWRLERSSLLRRQMSADELAASELI